MDLDIKGGRDADGRDRLTLTGSIDLVTRDQFVEAGRGALRDGAVTLVIDLAGVTFMDSTGIGSLIELTHDADDAGAGVVLAGASERIVRLLEITGLGDRWARES